MKPKKEIKFYFDYLSPWSYFAWLQLKKIAITHSVAIELQPVPYPKLSELWKQRAVATIPPKRLFIYKFAMRHALRNNIPFEMAKVHPYKPYTTLRMSLKEVVGDRQCDLVDALFHACWKDKVDMGSEAEIEAYLNIRGFDAEFLLSRTHEADVKDALVRYTNEAVALGVFGVPTVLIDDELFWGNDQFEYIRDYLEGNDLLVKTGRGEQILTSHSWGIGEPKA